MAPKNKGGSKGGGSSSNSKKDGDDSSKGGGKGVKGAQSLEIRHILHSKYSDSAAAAERLRNGEDFGKVAEDSKSEDKAKQKGLLGWKTKNDVVAPFWDAAVKLEASSTSKPVWAEVKTEFGYHLVMVQGRK